MERQLALFWFSRRRFRTWLFRPGTTDGFLDARGRQSEDPIGQNAVEAGNSIIAAAQHKTIDFGAGVIILRIREKSADVPKGG